MNSQVLFLTGQAGTCKREVAEKLARRLAESRGVSVDLTHQDTKKIVRLFQVEDYIDDLPLFLDNYVARSRQEKWDAAIQRILDEIGSTPPQYLIIAFHYVYFRNGRLFAQANWDLLAKLRPRMIVTLIDDMFDIWERIRRREEEFATRSVVPLAAILLWRSFEIAGAQQLANNLFVKASNYGIDASREPWASVSPPFFGGPIEHFVVSVKHPIETIFKLFSQPDRLRIYASYPITKPRPHADGRAEIDAARAKLVREFIVFDPLTIDEYRTENDQDWQNAAEDFSHFPKRWPTSDIASLGPPAVEETVPRENPLARWDIERRVYERLTPPELRNLRLAVFGQVVDRDFQLVRQSQHLAVYRPFYDASPRPSGGVGEEIVFSGMCGVPVGMVHPPGDYHVAQDALFQRLGSWSMYTIIPPSQSLASGVSGLSYLDDLIAHLKKFEERMARR